MDPENSELQIGGSHRAEPVVEEPYAVVAAQAEDVVPAEVVDEDSVAPELPATALAPTEVRAADAGDRLSSDQLCDYLSRATFPTVLGRRGYQQDEVDAFLERLAESVRADEPLRELVRRTRFTTVRLEDGYDPHQVDEFLAAVVDLDPNADAVPAEDAPRNGLLSKLFG